MSYMDEYNKLKKKRLEQEAKASGKVTSSGKSSYMNEYNKLNAQSTGDVFFDRFIEHKISLGKKDKDEETESKKVKETEPKKEERKWFDTSVFDDGLQWSDIPKAVIGTKTDISTNLWSGILGIGEKIVDAGMTLGTAMNQSSMMQAAQTEMMVGALSGKETDGKAILSRYQQAQDEAEKATAEFVAKDLYDENAIARKIISDPVKKLTGIDSEKDSLLGAKSDSLVQSGGQLAAQIGANALVPGSGMALMATTAFGSEAENAFKNDATFDEALLSSTISAGAEILTERLGGISFGGKTLTDAAFNGLSRKMTSKIAKVLITSGKVAADMTAEGAEEILSGYMSAIGQKLTYMEDKEIKEIFSSEDMLESFIGGAVLGGAGSVGSVIQANSQGVDYVTGLTKNEQAVVQKVYEDELAKKEESGKVSSKEKNKLYNDVVRDMELGRIDTDTIESVLGGESYKGYQSMVEKETSLKKQSEDLTNEINTLLDKENPTMRDSERLAEARKELDQVKTNLEGIDTKTAKLNLFTEVDKLTANDTKLRESYYEKENRGKAFEADLTKYDAKQQETIKKAVESGILNNTRRTHEFVDLVAKISADQGVPFDFTNNQKLKESGFAIDGKQVNGFVTKDGITVNVNSAKSLDTVVGHEIAHVLEGTELYTELQTAIVEYAKSKNDYQGRYDTLTKLYEGVEGANIDSELTAELVGDYIFTDTDFIHNLSTNHRNVFQKVYDEVKYLYKVATAGSKEARELERVKKLFDEAYRAETKNTADSGVKYSIGETTDGRFAAVVDNDILSNIDTSSWDKATKKKVQKAASDELKKFSDGFTINGIEYVGNQESIREYTRSNYSEALAHHEPNAYLDKMRASAVLDDVIQVTTEWKNDNGLKHDRDDYVDFVRGNTLIKSGDRTYRAVVLAGVTSDGKAIFHDVVDVNPEAFEIKKSEPSTAVSVNESPNNILEDSDEVTVAQEGGSVNTQFSSAEEVTEAQNKQGLDAKSEVQYSLSRDSEYMDKSISANSSALHVSNDNMQTAKTVRERIAARMNDIKDRGLVALPDDIEGNTYIANSSYDGTEENTTICPRSLASEAFTDAVSEYLGRPLTVEEQIYISQDLQGRSLTPECTYCYVATDRKAYRAFLGEYINQRDAVIKKVQENPNADISRNGELYKEFLNGRKDTKPMYDRFKMWVDTYKNGKPMVEASNLANINKLMGDIGSEFGAELKPQIVDAMKYAQSASWAKKRVNYVAYNGHILKWKQDRINKLNSHYGLRMYSFSDFHPAFVLENMQMITDASVKGLKMLGYTKDIDFVEIFAPSGMNINVSTFGFETNGNVYENNLIGAEWEKAKALREKYPNVGVTFVATNDNLVNWALEQDWIDVVIPYHLVRTGAEVAKAFGYTNYTSESSDTKGEDWAKGKDKKYIAPTEHNNDKATYLDALSKNHLKPRFERFIDNPNYMKLVNECRQPASESKPVQPIFNEDAAMVALAKLEANGYYQPIGGSVDRMYEIAAEVAEDMTKQLAPVQHSLSEQGNVATTGKFLGKDIALETAPVAETTDTEADVAPTPATISNEETVEDYAPGESLEEQLAKADESVESLDTETEALFRDLSEQKITEAEFAEKWHDLDKRYTQARQEQERLNAEMTDINNRKYESIDDSEIPPEAEAPYYGDEEYIAPVDQTGERDADPFAERDMIEVGKRNVKAFMHDNPEVKPFFQDAARSMLFDLQNSTKGERLYNDQVYYESGGEQGWMGTSRKTTKDIAALLDQWGYSYAQIEAGLNAIIEGGGKENNAVSKRIEFMLDYRLRNGYKDVDGRPIPADEEYINLLNHRESFDSFMEVADQYAPPAEDVAPVKDVAQAEDVAPLKIEPAIEGEQKVLDGFKQAEQEQAPERLTRAKLHKQIVDGFKAELAKKGLDLDEVLKNAKRMNALSINDNTPQRVNDKTFGYEAGEALNELTFNKVALNESNGVKWLNEQVDTIKKLSKKYKIKPLSKESAAAQMYAEGFWVNDKDEIIAYGDAELAQDFPDVRVQNRIKALARDPVVRKIYDNTLSAINESRARNAYPEIPRLENYFLHFRAMDDTFSKLGVPFNPNDIKAKDLPTDINGTTIDRKPGQPFFASSMHREGKRTSFDLFGGLEKYLNSAKNQIYHIDDIQTSRALWGYIADRYGQAHGLENLDHMAYEAQAEHIQQVYDGHLSNYARFLVEYANHLAGKTALIDRGVEGLIGRRALQFINTVNMQTSRNQVGYSISSPLTNFIPSMEAIARTSKRDSIKAFAQTVSNVFRKDGFAESDPTLIRRRGTDKFAKTLWDKMSDPGFILMGAVDNVTSEFIVRTKYNELTRKGMDSKQAHIKAGEWASRIMGDRSLGQMPLHYNSKFMGLFTKYQLEVRNALDSQFYDTYQEAKTNTKEVENQKAKNALTATKFAYRAVQIAALNHVFGMAFEKIAGYNPAFDIISTIATLFGWDDDEEDEDTFGDNAEQALKELLGDLPYTSLFTDGGRIPIGSAMPIKQFVSGIDKYGNEKSRWETLAEAAPYYLLPGGYGQIKKTTQGLGMFSEEHPVSGSYTDSGNLRFPVEETFGNKLQAAVFGQYASENARDYFDNERKPLKEKQIQEFIDVDIPIKDYWDYREGLAKLKTNEDKVDYIDSLDLPLSKKNILVNNVLDRKEDVDLADYGEYGSLEEFDFAVKYPEKYQFFEEIGVTYEDYSKADDDTKDAYNWAFKNPDKYTVAKAISDDVVEYKSYTKGLDKIEADKDEDGKSINGSRKEKVFAYIESLPIDYGQKCILFKSQYKADDSMNMDIIEYLDSREDIDYDEMVTILKELDFTVEGNYVYWD